LCMLAVPPMGCINVHASLLPRLRGSAPIQWAVANGEARSGITIMKMDAGMDTGDMLLQRGFELTPDETACSLHDRLAALGGPCLLEALEGLAAGTLTRTPQDDAAATMAPMLTKEDGRLDFGLPAEEVDRRVRGMDPWPGAFTSLDGATLKVFGARLAAGQGGGAAGEVLDADDRGLLVACGQGTVWLHELQLPGRKRMKVAQLVAGRPIPRGTLLGEQQ
jgi:methionyl-tRNA formyltransferase